MVDGSEKLVRGLYAWEIEEFRPVFGDALKYEQVRIHEGSIWPDKIDRITRRLKGMPPPGEGYHNAITLGNHCYFPISLPKTPPAIGDLHSYTLDWLVHELTHVWQYQQMGWVYLWRVLHASFRDKELAYDYGGEDELHKSREKQISFMEFSPVQQGNITQAYYVRLRAGKDTSAWQPFIEEIHKTKAQISIGGAYVAGDVNVSGGDFVGRDQINVGGNSTNVGNVTGTGVAVGPGAQSTVTTKFENCTIITGSEIDVQEKKLLVQEEIRLDVAAPKEVVVGEFFEIAVAVKQRNSPPLTISDLEKIYSQDGEIFRERDDQIINYKVIVVAPDFDIERNSYLFRLEPGRDSKPWYFRLRSKRAGELPITVEAYQLDPDEYIVAQTKLQITAFVKSG